MRARHLIISTILFALSSLQSASAVLITSSLINIGGNTWQANYSVENDTLTADIELFAIYFADADYDNLSVISLPTDWGEFVFQPGELFAGEDGFVEFEALVAGIASGSTLSGFIIQFDFLATALPGFDLIVEVYDPLSVNLDIIDETSTPTPSVITNASAPGGLLLLSLAAFFMVRLKRTCLLSFKRI